LLCALVSLLVLPEEAVADCTADNDCGTCVHQVSGSMPWSVDCSYCTSTHKCSGEIFDGCDGGHWVGYSSACMHCVQNCPCILGKCNDQSICGPQAACANADACNKACMDRNGFNSNGCFMGGAWSSQTGAPNTCSCTGKDSSKTQVCSVGGEELADRKA
jgi:hypothetical protein